MHKAESVRVPFEFLLRHLDSMPEEFQMDNGCAFDQYTAYRSPELFENTRVTIDSTHARGHVHCLHSYSTDKSYNTYRYSFVSSRVHNQDSS
jgi:hypothetical protein